MRKISLPIPAFELSKPQRAFKSINDDSFCQDKILYPFQLLPAYSNLPKEKH